MHRLKADSWPLRVDRRVGCPLARGRDGYGEVLAGKVGVWGAPRSPGVLRSKIIWQIVSSGSNEAYAACQVRQVCQVLTTSCWSWGRRRGRATEKKGKIQGKSTKRCFAAVLLFFTFHFWLELARSEGSISLSKNGGRPATEPGATLRPGRVHHRRSAAGWTWGGADTRGGGRGGGYEEVVGGVRVR